MKSCPNITSQEWKTLKKAVGEREAYRDFFESGEKIRTPEEVLAKLSLRESTLAENSTNPLDYSSFTDVNIMFDNNSVDHLVASKEKIESDTALLLVDQMSKNLGVDYKIVTEIEARAITQKAVNKWDGQPGFFFGGTVYLVRDKFTLNTVFHEFSHPFVRSLAKENSQVFNKLYNDVVNTPEGRDIVESVKQNKALVPGTDLFKEEVIVRALENSFKKYNAKSPFGKAVANILYAIKQLLRRMFGKTIKISNLNENTTVEELANILSKEIPIEIDTDVKYITADDIVAYTNETLEGVSENLMDVNHATITTSINAVYEELRGNIQMFKNTDITDQIALKYVEIADIVYNDPEDRLFHDIYGTLNKWKGLSDEQLTDLKNKVGESEERVKALASTLLRLNTAMKMVSEAASDVSENPNSQEAIGKLHYYNEFAKSWEAVLKQSLDAFSREGIKAGSELRVNVTETLDYLNSIKKDYTKVAEEAAIDVIYDQFRELGDQTRKRYEKRIAERKKKGDNQLALDKLHLEFYNMTEAERAEYLDLLRIDSSDNVNLTPTQTKKLNNYNQKAKHSLEMSREKIKQTIKGNMGDAGFMNSFFEGYLYNSDPIVGGLALYMKNTLNDAMIVTHRNANEFSDQISPLLKKFGYTASDQYKLRNAVGFEDTISTYDEEGNVVEKKVWTFLNDFKNYRSFLKTINNEVELATQEYNLSGTTEAKEALKEAISVRQKAMNTYFHQEYVSEIYELEDKFSSDDIGKEAFFQRTLILDNIKSVNESNEGNMNDPEVVAELDALWRRYARLYSLTDEYGEIKSNIPDESGVSPYDVAMRLRTFRTESKKFYTYKLRKGSFEKAYNDQIQYLDSVYEKSLDPDSDYQQALQIWLSRNTKQVLKPEHDERRNNILDAIKRLLSDSNLPKDLELEAEKSKLYENLFEITSGFKNEKNELMGSEFTPEALAKIKKIQERLKEISTEEVKNNGLTGKENARYSYLYELGRENRTTEEDIEKRELDEKKRNFGLSSEIKDQLAKLYEELSGMNETLPTDDYLEVINNYVQTTDNGVRRATNNKGITKLNANVVLIPSMINPLLEEDPKFKKWFEANHMLTIKLEETPDGDKMQVERYERTYAWSVRISKDPAMMESYEFVDYSGENVKIQGVPSGAYYSREVKGEYVNKKIIGKTIDNQNQFLPKSKTLMDKSNAEDKYKFINEEYLKLKNDPSQKDRYDLLVALKENHLKYQEAASYSNRLYYDMPRYTKDNLEVLQSTNLGASNNEKENFFTYQLNRTKEFFKRTASDAEDNTINQDENLNLVRADIFDQRIKSIPVSGLYDIAPDDVSPNIITGMMKYMGSIQKENKLVESSPIVKAIQSTVNNVEENAIKSQDVNKRLFNTQRLIRYIPALENVRKKAVNNLIEREYEGKTNTGPGSDNAALNNTINKMFKVSSFSFFAMNIPSALKNSLGMKFQSLILSAGKDDLDPISLQKGNAWAYQAMVELSFGGQLTVKGSKSLTQQTVDIFDMSQDRFIQNIGKNLSRSMTGDLASFSWINSPRKWVELQATIQLSAGMLEHKKVEQVLEDGSVKEIPYLKAFELVDGVITLKKGIDVKYAPEITEYAIQEDDTVESIAKKFNTSEETIMTALKGRDLSTLVSKAEIIEYNRNLEIKDVQEEIENIDEEDPVLATRRRAKLEEDIREINSKYDDRLSKNLLVIDNSGFKYMKNRMHQTQNNLGGAYAKFDQPEAQRYILFRMFSFMRKFFTPMFVDRFGFSGKLSDPKARLNPGLGGHHMGYYVQFAKTVYETITTLGKNLSALTPEEKIAAAKFISEFLLLTLLSIASSMMGWDEDDDDRFKKLEQKSGPLPFFGLTQGKVDFDLMGWLNVHTLHMIMAVRAENEQFNPLTGGLKPYTDLLEAKSIANGPTIDVLKNLWGDIANAGTNKAVYTRDMGDFFFQKAGQSKWINHLAKVGGFTGNTVSPIKGIRNIDIHN